MSTKVTRAEQNLGKVLWAHRAGDDLDLINFEMGYFGPDGPEVVQQAVEQGWIEHLSEHHYQVKQEFALCNTCYRYFPDIYPSARCPFEYEHPEEV
jgi:hypothetical protein